jgi:hypothetical protein
MEKEYTQVEQELEINSKQEEKIDTSKLDDISSET